jgi:SSS family solute:Na+ symporter
VVWLAVTLLTEPEPRATLDAFYRKVRPAGPGWGVVARESGIAPIRGELSRNAIAWVLGVVLVYSIMFATGAAIFHNMRQFVIFGGALVVSAVLLVMVMRREQADALQ